MHRRNCPPEVFKSCAHEGFCSRLCPFPRLNDNVLVSYNPTCPELFSDNVNLGSCRPCRMISCSEKGIYGILFMSVFFSIPFLDMDKIEVASILNLPTSLALSCPPLRLILSPLLHSPCTSASIVSTMQPFFLPLGAPHRSTSLHPCPPPSAPCPPPSIDPSIFGVGLVRTIGCRSTEPGNGRASLALYDENTHKCQHTFFSSVLSNDVRSSTCEHMSLVSPIYTQVTILSCTQRPYVHKYVSVRIGICARPRVLKKCDQNEEKKCSEKAWNAPWPAEDK